MLWVGVLDSGKLEGEAEEKGNVAIVGEKDILGLSI